MAGMPPSSTHQSWKPNSAHIAGGLVALSIPGPSEQASLTCNSRHGMSSGLPTPVMCQYKDTPLTQTNNSLESPPRGHGRSSIVDTPDEFMVHIPEKRTETQLLTYDSSLLRYTDCTGKKGNVRKQMRKRKMGLSPRCCLISKWTANKISLLLLQSCPAIQNYRLGTSSVIARPAGTTPHYRFRAGVRVLRVPAIGSEFLQVLSVPWIVGCWQSSAIQNDQCGLQHLGTTGDS